MASMRSGLNSVLRKCSQVVSPQNPIRRSLSRTWSRLLESTGAYVDVRIGQQSLKLLVRFRHLCPDYEADTLSVWLQLLKPGMTVWDVGANLGLYTVLSARAIGPLGRVAFWEPAPESFAAAQAHVAANGMSDTCVPNQAAISDEDEGTAVLSIADGQGTSPMNRISKTVAGDGIEVPVTSLNAQLAISSRTPDVVKLDIEGAEVHALRGGSQLLDGARPLILLAVHPMFLPEFNCTPDHLIEICQTHNYTALDMKGREVTSLVYDEYLLVPDERVGSLKEAINWR